MSHKDDGRPLDLLVDGSFRIAVRAARRTTRPINVTSRTGKRYSYRYAEFAWNLHRHGRRPALLPDAWCLVELKREYVVGCVYVVPSGDASVGAFTVSVTADPQRARRPGSRLMPWLERWDIVTPKQQPKPRRAAA